MNNNRQVFLLSLFTLLKLSNYFIFASNLPSGNEISSQISSKNLKDNITDWNHEMPLDLTVRDTIRSQNDISLQQSFSNSIKQNNSTLFSENPLTLSSNLFQSKEMISDPLINSTIQEINERKELKKYFVISKRSLRFFITKNNVHNILTSELNPDSFSRLIRLHRQKLLIPKLTMLNVKIDVIETLSELFFKNVTGVINSSFFKTEFGLEIFLTNLTSIMKSNPIHVKADPETRFKLGEFSQILYQVYLKPSISFSMSMISRYIKSNHNKFSLQNLLNTLISVVLESKNIQNDLKSIAFTILFFYNHADKKLIKNMDFIVKDMMIKIISLVNLYKIIEEDANQSLQKKQKFYDNIEREIKKSFVMAFYLRDLKLAMSNIDALKDEILHSKLALKVDFSFVVILLKTFKTVHCLKSILHGLKYESCEPLAEEARLSVKKMFEFKESLFDVFKKVL